MFKDGNRKRRVVRGGLKLKGKFGKKRAKKIKLVKEYLEKKDNEELAPIFKEE